MEIFYRLAVRCIVGLAFLIFLHKPVRAEVSADCFEIVSGSLPHIRMVDNHAVDFAIDSYGEAGWRVSVHHTQGVGRVENATLGQKINNQMFNQDLVTIEGVGEDFCFAFRWWHEVNTLPSGTATLYWYGWVTLGTVNGQLVIKACERSEIENEVTVGGADLNLQELDFLIIDHGDWVELDSPCVPRDTQGCIAIPSCIDGKPVRAIADAAFLGCSSISEIVIPDGVLSIGEAAFQSCSQLLKLEIPSSVTNVGEYVIHGCERLGELTINATLSTFGYKAFSGSGITNLIFGAGITNIDNYAFAGNRNLRSVSIPQNVRRICKWSFDESYVSLRSVSVPYATVIEDEAFPSGCTITRYGPVISAGGVDGEIDEETKIAFMRTLELKDYDSASRLSFVEAPPGDSDGQPVTAPVACAHLGISPFAIETWNDKGHKGVQYKMPSVEIVGFDHMSGIITGRVIPAEGTRIVSEPFKRAFGFQRYEVYSECGEITSREDVGLSFYYSEPGYSLDFTDYCATGVFRMTYPSLNSTETKGAILLRLKLQDYACELW